MTESIRIPIGPSGKVVAWATVDGADYERLIVHRWYLAGRGYAFRPTSDGKSVFMHREVLGFPDGEDIDHINRDKLDNRRANLRACTHLENCLNSERSENAAATREMARALWDEGLNRPEIAARLGCSVGLVSKALRGQRYAEGKHPNMSWPRERLIEFVRDFHAAHGRLPRQSEMDGKDGRPWFTTVYRRFESKRALVEAAGFEYARSARRAA